MNNTRAGRPYRRARQELLARGEIQFCWSCGKQLHRDLPRTHPNSITLGHYVAIEDGGSLLDPTNYGPQCPACNYRDGARRTNRNKATRKATRRMAQPTTYANPEW